jgi:hypothetical protein
LDCDSIPPSLRTLHQHAHSIIEYRNKCPPDISTTQTVNIKVQRKVQEFKIVGNSSKYLKIIWMIIINLKFINSQRNINFDTKHFYRKDYTFKEMTTFLTTTKNEFVYII